MSARAITDFAGLWHIVRHIDDRITGQTGAFVGTARFNGDGLELHYFEEGQLTLGSSQMAATRRYTWRANGQGIDVFFEDGRFFHRIEPNGQAPTASHFCDPDQYDVGYAFDRWPEWSSEWRVKGPRKDYTMKSVYRRGGHSSA